VCRRPYRGSGGQSPASHRGVQSRPQASSCDISGGRCVTVIVPLLLSPPRPVPRFSPVSISPPILHTYLHYQKDERVKTLEKIVNSVLPDMGAHLTEKFFHVSVIN